VTVLRTLRWNAARGRQIDSVRGFECSQWGLGWFINGVRLTEAGRVDSGRFSKEAV